MLAADYGKLQFNRTSQNNRPSELSPTGDASCCAAGGLLRSEQACCGIGCGLVWISADPCSIWPAARGYGGYLALTMQMIPAQIFHPESSVVCQIESECPKATPCHYLTWIPQCPFVEEKWLLVEHALVLQDASARSNQSALDKQGSHIYFEACAFLT